MSEFFPEPWSSILLFIYGLILGSFMNVCIYRMPHGKSIIQPASHCPECEEPLKWYDNIPLLSFSMLRGKCRHCGHKISMRYVWVELACGLIWLALWRYYGFTAFLCPALALATLSIAVSFTDLETGLIPDKLTISGMILGLAFSALFPSIHGKIFWYEGLLESFLGFWTGGLILYTIGVVGKLILKKDCMGGGDIKLLAMIGTFIGMQKVLFALMLSPFLALPFAFYMKFFRKSEMIPYGPFLALSGCVFYLAGPQIVSLILNIGA